LPQVGDLRGEVERVLIDDDSRLGPSLEGEPARRCGPIEYTDLDGLGVERLPVVELHAPAQEEAERVGGAELPALGQHGLDLEVGAHVHERFVDVGVGRGHAEAGLGSVRRVLVLRDPNCELLARSGLV